MAAALTFTPASGSITAAVSVVRVNVTGADDNAADGTEKRYTIVFENPDGDNGVSYVFNVGSDGKHEFNSYIFPNAGSWTVNLVDEDDATTATASVTVR
jgi:hypothetical protein